MVFYPAALEFATAAHAGAVRKGEPRPYIEHPLMVVDILTSVGYRDDIALSAAIMHDVIEDTPHSEEELADAFGVEIASIVAELSDPPELKGDAKHAYIMEAAKRFSPRAAMVKVADKTANCSDILSSPPPWDSARKIKYFERAKELVDAIDAYGPLKEKFYAVYARKEEL